LKMVIAKVYKKTKVVDTPLATVHIESEFYEQASERRPAAEGPPRWLSNADPSRQNPDVAKQSEQKYHLNYLFQLGQHHSMVSCGVQEHFSPGEEKSAGSRSFEEKTGESVGAHRAASTRQLDTSSEAFGDDSNQLSNLKKTQESVPERYLGINLRDISNKLFMATIDSQNRNDETDGVEETKEEDGAALPKKGEGLSSITGFDIGKVISKNLFKAMPAMPAMSLFSKSSDDELNDPAKGKAPLFTEEIREKQRKSLAPVDEIRILGSCDNCADLLSVEDSGCYLQRIQSDDMSCVTMPNMNDVNAS